MLPGSLCPALGGTSLTGLLTQQLPPSALPARSTAISPHDGFMMPWLCFLMFLFPPAPANDSYLQPPDSLSPSRWSAITQNLLPVPILYLEAQHLAGTWSSAKLKALCFRCLIFVTADKCLGCPSPTTQTPTSGSLCDFKHLQIPTSGQWIL